MSYCVKNYFSCHRSIYYNRYENLILNTYSNTQASIRSVLALSDVCNELSGINN